MDAIAVKKPAVAETGSTIYAFIEGGRPVLVEIGKEGMAYSKIFSGRGMAFEAGVAYSGDEDLHDRVFLLQKDEKGRLVNIDRLVVYSAAMLSKAGESMPIKFVKGNALYESALEILFDMPELLLFEEKYAAAMNIRLDSDIVLHLDPTMRDAYTEEIKKIARSFYKK